MEFPIPRLKSRNLENYHQQNREIAYEFARHVKKEVGDYVKIIVLFGSSARRQESGDVDILIVLDDTLFEPSPEFNQAYRIIVENIIRKVSRKLHVTTFRLTSFWEYLRAGDPVAINILRDGVALLDVGLFDPLQMLLFQGRIRPTPESAYAYFARAPVTIHNAQWHVLQGTLDLYWAVIDSAHAALIKVNAIPVSPEFVPQLMEERLVKPGIIDKKYPKIASRFYHISRGILHNQITHVSGEEFDEYVREAAQFVDAMKDVVSR